MAAAPQGRRSIEENEPSRTESTHHASFYVNDKPVRISAEKPTVRQVIRAAGFDPDKCEVYKLSQQDDPTGRRIGLDVKLEASGDRPVYLRCEEKGKTAPLTGIAPGAVTTPEAENRLLGVRDIEQFGAPDRPRDFTDTRPPTRP